MRYFDFIKEIKEISTSHILVNEYGEGDIYEYLNNGEHKYPCIFLTVTNLNTTDSGTAINFTLFYTDRLVENQANKTSIQSTGISVIKQILSKYEQLHPEYLLSNVNYTPFTEKFTDMCAGVFCDVVIENQIDTLENYDNECEEGAFAVKTITLTKNGVYDIVGYDSAVVLVEADCHEYEELVDELTNTIEQQGAEIDALNMTIEQKDIIIYEKDDQINSVTTLSITQNGTYTPPTDVLGYNEITVDVPVDSVNSIIYMKDYGLKFAYYKNEEIPDNIIFDGVDDFSYMFYNCTMLKSLPEFDSSQSTTFYDCFYKCTSLTTIPQIDTSKSTNFGYMFQGCTGLVTIPALDTSLGSNLTSAFNGCTALTNIDAIDFGSKLTNSYSSCIASQAFNNCSSLKTIGKTNFTNLNTGTAMFRGCTLLENIVVEGSINIGLDFSPCTKLTYNSVKSILTACSNTTKPTTSKTILFNVEHTDQNVELFALIADCNTKGWTISGLIIN